MKIMPVNKNPVNFSRQYKTEDVLRLVTFYPYKNKSTDGSVIESLTGIDIFSKEFQSTLPKDAVYLYVYVTIMTMCQEEILKQHPELQEISDSFDCKLHLTEGKKAQNQWFRNQLKKLPDILDIEPFKLNRKKGEDIYKKIEEIYDAVL